MLHDFLFFLSLRFWGYFVGIYHVSDRARGVGLAPAHILKKCWILRISCTWIKTLKQRKMTLHNYRTEKCSTLLSEVCLKVMLQLLPERKWNLVLIIVFYINRKRLMTSLIAKLHRTGEPNRTLPNVKKVMPHSTLLIRSFLGPPCSDLWIAGLACLGPGMFIIN